MNARRLLLLCAAALLAAGSAVADMELTFVGVNGATGFGYYVGPYYGTLDGDPVTLYCDDFANHVSLGQSWLANLTLLGSGDLSNTRYGGLPDALTLYEEAAWLTTQYAQNPNDYPDIQATIWQLFVPAAPSPSSNQWFSLAAANYQNIDPRSFSIVTNVAPVYPTGQVQEFMIDPAPVPEPSSILLLGTVVLLLVFLIPKRTSAHLVRRKSVWRLRD